MSRSPITDQLRFNNTYQTLRVADIDLNAPIDPRAMLVRIIYEYIHETCFKTASLRFPSTDSMKIDDFL